jgi:signal transduction histidine kinase
LRIAAEAIANALKHAQAGRVAIALGYDAGAVRLEVADDGAGFIIEQAPGHTAGHFGLIGMRERTRKMGGAFELESTPGRGTRLEIRVPHPPANGPGAAPPPSTLP